MGQREVRMRDESVYPNDAVVHELAELRRDLGAEHLANPLSSRCRRERDGLASVLSERETDVRSREREARYELHDVAGLGRRRLQELPTCRRGDEQIADLDPAS